MPGKKVTIFGSTGSVGRSSLKVIEAMPDQFELVMLVAHRSKGPLLEQALRFRPKVIAISAEEDARWLASRLEGSETRVIHGDAALLAAIGEHKVDLTISAMVGAAGLRPTLAAIRAGSHIGLANKETMVVAGAFMNRAAREAGIEILPIDSEHNALHQCLRGETHAEVKRLILTASGGPFRTYDQPFEEIKPEQALRHPTWDMGPKITIDSATMMNKGLEVIEAHHLFDMPHDRISIVVHPQSIVHSMIETVDGSYKCQLGRTDMCDPIQYALTWPKRVASPFEGFDITKGAHLDFYEADPVRFPCIRLAYEALRQEGTGPAVLNAANEISVAAFLDHRIRFTDIPRLNEHCLQKLGGAPADSLEQILAADQETRELARELVEQWAIN